MPTALTSSHPAAARDTGPADLAVHVRGLRKSYGDRPAVDGLDLDVDRGEIVALLGPNGAGKTTVVELLGGGRTRDAGTVRVLGEDPDRAGRIWRSRLGLVPQVARDRAGLTVTEELDAAARASLAPAAVTDIIDAVGLTGHGAARRSQLSSGQGRRLDLAAAIVGRPALLLLDEPTVGLDVAARRRVENLLRRLRRDGATIILTTHDVEEAARIADRIVVIDHGRVVASGAPDTLGDAEARVPVVSWSDRGGLRTQATTTPTAMVIYLAAMGLDGMSGGEIPDLTVVRPTLEDVYLGLLDAGEA